MVWELASVDQEISHLPKYGAFNTISQEYGGGTA
jgi:hypothetical protein